MTATGQISVVIRFAIVDFLLTNQKIVSKVTICSSSLFYTFKHIFFMSHGAKQFNFGVIVIKYVFGSTTRIFPGLSIEQISHCFGAKTARIHFLALAAYFKFRLRFQKHYLSDRSKPKDVQFTIYTREKLLTCTFVKVLMQSDSKVNGHNLTVTQTIKSTRFKPTVYNRCISVKQFNCSFPADIFTLKAYKSWSNYTTERLLL